VDNGECSVSRDNGTNPRCFSEAEVTMFSDGLDSQEWGTMKCLG
jgi:hypothetical protein